MNNNNDKELYQELNNFIVDDFKTTCDYVMKCVLLTFPEITEEQLLSKRTQRNHLYWSKRIFWYLIATETGESFRYIENAYNRKITHKQIHYYYTECKQAIKDNNANYKSVINTLESISKRVKQWKREIRNDKNK